MYDKKHSPAREALRCLAEYVKEKKVGLCFGWWCGGGAAWHENYLPGTCNAVLRGRSRVLLLLSSGVIHFSRLSGGTTPLRPRCPGATSASWDSTDWSTCTTTNLMKIVEGNGFLTSFFLTPTPV